MIKYPLYFHAKSHATHSTQAPWNTYVPHMGSPLTCAIPAEFEGPGQGYSPEDFYLLAASNCFIATFKVFAEKSKLNFKTIEIDSTLTLDRDEHGIPWMAEVKLEINLIEPSNRDQAVRLLTKTSQSCFVLNSVKSNKIFLFKIDNVLI